MKFSLQQTIFLVPVIVNYMEKKLITQLNLVITNSILPVTWPSLYQGSIVFFIRLMNIHFTAL